MLHPNSKRASPLEMQLIGGFCADVSRANCEGTGRDCKSNGRFRPQAGLGLFY